MNEGDVEVQQGGVAIMKSTKISRRIMKARFYLKCIKLTVIQAYAQTKHAMDEVKDKLCNQLQDTLSTCNTHDMNVVMGDLNAKVGKDNTNRGKVMGSHGVGVMNDNGERLCDFCRTNGLVITGSRTKRSTRRLGGHQKGRQRTRSITC